MREDHERNYKCEIRHTQLNRRIDSLDTIRINGETYYLKESGEKTKTHKDLALKLAKSFLRKPIGRNTLVIDIHLRYDN